MQENSSCGVHYGIVIKNAHLYLVAKFTTATFNFYLGAQVHAEETAPLICAGIAKLASEIKPVLNGSERFVVQFLKRLTALMRTKLGADEFEPEYWTMVDEIIRKRQKRLKAIRAKLSPMGVANLAGQCRQMSFYANRNNKKNNTFNTGSPKLRAITVPIGSMENRQLQDEQQFRLVEFIADNFRCDCMETSAHESGKLWLFCIFLQKTLCLDLCSTFSDDSFHHLLTSVYRVILCIPDFNFLLKVNYNNVRQLGFMKSFMEKVGDCVSILEVKLLLRTCLKTAGLVSLKLPAVLSIRNANERRTSASETLLKRDGATASTSNEASTTMLPRPFHYAKTIAATLTTSKSILRQREVDPISINQLMQRR